jgi:hypothetical protein
MIKTEQFLSNESKEPLSDRIGARVEELRAAGVQMVSVKVDPHLSKVNDQFVFRAVLAYDDGNS